MRLLKAKYRDRNGAIRQAAKWYVEFRDHHERTHRLAAYTSRSASDELKRNLEKLVSYYSATGGQIDPALQRWIDDLPRRIRDNLLRIGLVDRRRAGATRSLSQLVSQWQQDLASRGTSSKQTTLVVKRVNRILDECRFKRIADIRGAKVAEYLATLRKPGADGSPISERTSNFYLGAINQFCRWLVKEGHAHANPVAQLNKITVTDSFKRRALTLDEQSHLIRATMKGEQRFGMSGPQRAMLYRVALATGFRVSELASLKRSSFQLAGDPPMVTLSAPDAKNRKSAVQPIPPDLARDLTTYLSNKADDDRAFTVPPNYDTAPMIRADLKEARQAWLREAESDEELTKRDQSDFLKQSSPQGRVDFHSLRHTFGTALAKAGVAPKVAMDLM